MLVPVAASLQYTIRSLPNTFNCKRYNARIHDTQRRYLYLVLTLRDDAIPVSAIETPTSIAMAGRGSLTGRRHLVLMRRLINDVTMM